MCLMANEADGEKEQILFGNFAIVCDECGAEFPNDELGIEGLWSHACQ